MKLLGQSFNPVAVAIALVLGGAIAMLVFCRTGREGVQFCKVGGTVREANTIPGACQGDAHGTWTCTCPSTATPKSCPSDCSYGETQAPENACYGC